MRLLCFGKLDHILIDDAAHRADISEDAMLALQHCGVASHPVSAPHVDIRIAEADVSAPHF